MNVVVVVVVVVVVIVASGMTFRVTYAALEVASVKGSLDFRLPLLLSSFLCLPSQ